VNPQERKAEIDALFKEQQAAKREFERLRDRVEKLERANTWSRDATSELGLARQRYDTAIETWDEAKRRLAKGE